MSDEPRCPICYPPRQGEPPPEVALDPDACPARRHHELLTRMFKILRHLETGIPSKINLEACARVRADINELRREF